MTGQKIDGLLVSNILKDRLRKAVQELKSDGIIPCLATILVGDDSASATYVKNKQKACSEIGIATKDHRLSQTFSQEELNSLANLLNNDESVHGILIQLPLPSSIDEFLTLSKISPLKDVDGLTPYNMGLLAAGRAIFKPCTPSGIMELLDHYNISVDGKNVVIVNRSNLVGKPLFHLFLQKNATVTICHSKTINLQEHCLAADILVTAVGDRKKFVLRGDMVKQGSVVFDVGIDRLDGKITGDVKFNEIIEKASYVSPVPGGVGPMTVTMLLKNTVTAASISKRFVPS